MTCHSPGCNRKVAIPEVHYCENDLFAQSFHNRVALEEYRFWLDSLNFQECD